MFRALVIFAFMLALAVPAIAQDAAETKPPLLMLEQQDPTHPERILMAFHKLAGIEPDYAKWASKSPFLKSSRSNDSDMIISREQNRLSRLWVEYEPANETIVVHTSVLLDEYSTIGEVLTLSEFTPKTFFSYNIYGESVAIVPKDIATFNKINISKVQMEEMLQKGRGSQVTAELILKPIVADGKTPFTQGDLSYWLLLAEIGEIRLWTLPTDGPPQLLWMHRADNFKPPVDPALLKLKQGQ